MQKIILFVILHSVKIVNAEERKQLFFHQTSLKHQENGISLLGVFILCIKFDGGTVGWTTILHTSFDFLPILDSLKFEVQTVLIFAHITRLYDP